VKYAEYILSICLYLTVINILPMYIHRIYSRYAEHMLTPCASGSMPLSIHSAYARHMLVRGRGQSLELSDVHMIGHITQHGLH
jgi:hypothetical protein